MTAAPPVRRSTRIGTGQLNLVNSPHVNISRLLNLPKRISYCKHDDRYPPWDPPYRSSLNNTFPETPDISQSFLDSVGITQGEGNYPFDCFVELPGGVVVFEVCSMPRNWEKMESMPPKVLLSQDIVLTLFFGQIKGEIDSDFHIAYEVWLSVLVFNWKIVASDCEIFNLEKKPCAFNIEEKYFSGQGGLYPKDDEDPKWIDLCVKVEGSVTIPYTGIKKTVHFEHCFYRFPRGDEVTPTS